MKVRDYVRTLAVLEAKRAEFESLVNGSLGVHTLAILQREIENAITDIVALESLELEAKPQIIRIGLVDEVPMLNVGEEFTLAINYTLTDGSLKGFGLEPKANVVISDVDAVYDNVGFITSIEANEYKGLVDMSLKLTRTANGFDVFDDNGTQGLHVVEDDSLFTVVDTFGDSLGINFTEEGTVPGDDFRVLVIRNVEPLLITVNDNSVLEVEGTTVRALQAGATQINIEGDGIYTMVDVEVKDLEQDVPEEPESIDPPGEDVEEVFPEEVEEPTVEAMRVVKRMTVKTNSGEVEAIVGENSVEVTLPLGAVTDVIEAELEDATTVPAGAKAVMNYSFEEGVSEDYVADYGTVEVDGNTLTITPIGDNGTAGYEGTVKFKVVDADGSDIEGLDLPIITLTVTA